MDLPKLILLRHGETVWNTEGRVQGRKDSALTQKGRDQAAAQGRLLQSIPEVKTGGFDILCSPLGRARATATIALRGIPIAMTLDVRLQEVSAGEWEGRTRDDLFAQFGGEGGISNEFDLFTSAPGGERFDELEMRCTAFLNDLSGPTVVITHGVTSLMLRGLACGLARDEMEALPRGQGCLYVIEQGSETCLSEPAA